jgi:hypothetical protein
VIHYHGTPITPRAVLDELAGRHFCVSYAAPAQVERCHEIGQSVMLDNGAFSFWRDKGRPHPGWPAYYRWAKLWLEYPTTWAVIPDVIDGSVEENDALIEEWPHGTRGAPVWHVHEPIDRLVSLATTWPRVCVGSSGEYSSVGSKVWHLRMAEAMLELCGQGAVPTWLHMLRGMALSGTNSPCASVDSTDIARNWNRKRNPVEMADRWDAWQNPARWIKAFDPTKSQYVGRAK